MAISRGRFGAVRLAWADAAADTPDSTDAVRALGAQQVRRHAELQGIAASRFLLGRALLIGLIGELSDSADLKFTTTCERCGADHGRPRLDGILVEVSVSYSGSMVAVAAVPRADAVGVGVDIERAPDAGASTRLHDLAPLFAPAGPPDTQEWTLIEAALKADGRGIAVELAHIRVGVIGSGRTPGARAIALPGRSPAVDAALIAGPPGFVLSAATVPVVGVRHPE